MLVLAVMVYMLKYAPMGRGPPSGPRCACPPCAMGGVARWSHGTVEAQRVCSATRTSAWARAQTEQRRHASTPGWGHGEGSAAWTSRVRRHGSARAVGPAVPGTPAAHAWGGRCGGARSARGTSTANAGAPARNAGPRCSASPPGARSTDISGGPGGASGGMRNAAGTTIPTAAPGMPPACKRAATPPDGWCCSGASGGAHPTVTRGQAPPQSWSAAKVPDHGSSDDPRRDRPPSRHTPTCGSAYCCRARCEKTARRDLCGGRWVTGGPTAMTPTACRKKPQDNGEDRAYNPHDCLERCR